MPVYSMSRMPSLLSKINEACDEQLLLSTKYCYGRKENMQLRYIGCYTNRLFFTVLELFDMYKVIV